MDITLVPNPNKADGAPVSSGGGGGDGPVAYEAYDLAVTGTDAAAAAMNRANYAVSLSGTAISAVEAYSLANTALNTAWAGTSVANAAYPIAVYGTTVAGQAYALAVAGTNAATVALDRANYAVYIAGTATGGGDGPVAYEALNTAWAGTRVANEAYPIAVYGTTVANQAYGIAVWGTNRANSAYDLAVTGTDAAAAAMPRPTWPYTLPGHPVVELLTTPHFTQPGQEPAGLTPLIRLLLLEPTSEPTPIRWLQQVATWPGRPTHWLRPALLLLLALKAGLTPLIRLLLLEPMLALMLIPWPPQAVTWPGRPTFLPLSARMRLGRN